MSTYPPTKKYPTNSKTILHHLASYKEKTFSAVIDIVLNIASYCVRLFVAWCQLMIIKITSWKQTASSCWSFCSVSQSSLLPNEMPALPGSSLTTHLTLDALATGIIQRSCVVQTFHSFVLASVWPTTIELGLLNMELVHTLHTTILLLLLVMSSLFKCQVMCPYSMSSCVGH